MKSILLNRSIIYSIGLAILFIFYWSDIIYLSHNIQSHTDFKIFYHTAESVNSGVSIYPGATLFDQLGRARNPELNSPFFAFIISPLSHLNYASAFYCWSILSLLAAMTAVLLIQKYLNLNQKNSAWQVGIIIAFFIYFPVFVCLHLAQTSFFLLLLLVLSWHALRIENNVLAGIYLGLAFSLKLFFAIFLLFLVLQKNWKAFLSWLITNCSIFIFTLIVFDKYIYVDYIRTFALIKWYAAAGNASLFGFFTRLFGRPDEMQFAFWPHLFWLNWSYYISLLFITFCLFWNMVRIVERTPRENLKQFDLSFCFTVVAMLLLSPLSWIYYFPLLSLCYACVWYWSESSANKNIIRILLGIVLFLTGMPSNMTNYKIPNLMNTFVWSGCYVYGLVLLAIMVCYMNKVKSIDLLDKSSMKLKNGLIHQHYIVIYSTVLFIPLVKTVMLISRIVF